MNTAWIYPVIPAAGVGTTDKWGAAAGAGKPVAGKPGIIPADHCVAGGRALSLPRAVGGLLMVAGVVPVTR